MRGKEETRCLKVISKHSLPGLVLSILPTLQVRTLTLRDYLKNLGQRQRLVPNRTPFPTSFATRSRHVTELWQKQQGQKWYPFQAWFFKIPPISPQAVCQLPAGRCPDARPSGESLLPLEAPAGDTADGTGGSSKIWGSVCFGC